MKFKRLDEDNFIMFAVKHYDNPDCKNLEEFYEDLSTIIYLKRLFKKYEMNGEIKEQLILNHIITFYNLFGIEASTRILFQKIDKQYYPILKTFLIYLNYIRPDKKYEEWELDLIPIPLDLKIVEKLRGI